MKVLNSVIIMWIFLFATTACLSQPVTTLSREPQMNEIEQKIKTLQNQSAMPGLQIVVSEDEKTIFEYTNGIRAEGQAVPITSNDKWHIGSCTKPMTAFLIGRLIDEGKLNWTTRLEEVVPRDYQLAPSAAVITIEQLLSHSSGLAEVTTPDNGKLWPLLYTNNEKPEVMREKLVRGLLKSPLNFSPGSKFEYSNSGYVVLGWIIEQVRNNSWEVVLKEEMFRSLGMNSCGFGPAGVESKKTAVQPWSHELSADKLQTMPPGLSADNPPALGPAGTVHCTVNDWRKFLKLFIDNEGVKSKFLSQKTFDKLLSSAGEGPYTFSSIGRMERPWAKGTAFAMAGSNTYNYAIVAIAPSVKRIYTINTNAGHQKAEESVTKILKLITDLK
jgi:CubicO group peptidase (beta-lactamase class C family)